MTRLFAALIGIILPFACTNGADTLSGGKQRPPASSDADARKTASTTSETERNAGTTSTGTSSATDEDEDVVVIPPEVVSGAYLTCADIPPALAEAREGYGYHGCVTLDADGDRVSLDHVKKDFALQDRDGHDVEADVVKLDTVDQDVIWEVPQAVLQHGLRPRMTVYDDAGEPQTVKTRGSVTINNPQEKIFGKDQEQ